MAITVLVGAQWGDEGKGKIIDYLSEDQDLIVRFQGGDNAGHTVINDYGVFKLHLIPSGIFNKNGESLIGTGTVVNPDVLEEEIAQIESAGVDMSGLKISGKAHILMPYHQKLDELMEAKGGIGTTKRGIGVAYSYKMLRKNLRFEDLLDLENAILIHDPKHELAAKRERELELIRTHTTTVRHYRDLQSIADYPVKVRKLIRRLRRIRIDRLISRIL